jgi:hypothetical protein
MAMLFGEGFCGIGCELIDVVLQGQKIFYVVEPSEENLKQFVAYQNDPKRSEYFFGDRLPPNSVHKVGTRVGSSISPDYFPSHFVILSHWL